MSSYLQDLGPEAVSHRQQVDEVKQQLGITHAEFDCWIYGFLENKKFSVEETVLKLQRRFAMEVDELGTYEITDFMRTSLRSGIIQVIGEDKCGRVAFYVNTRRDHPESSRRNENRCTFDMMVSYGTRLRAENKRCQMVMLINQEKASLWSNIDMTFQADIALRIAKFYPGAVDKMYICNMNRTLAAMAKPVFSRLPPIVSDRIIIIDDSDMKNGMLLNLFDESVLPVTLGGSNNCDDEAHWNQHAKVIEDYYIEMKDAIVNQHLTVKEWELLRIRPHRVYSRLASTIFDAESMTQLKTCYSECGSSYNDDLVQEEMELQDMEEANEWRAVMESFPPSLSLLFLEELQRWRLAVTAEETSARYALLDEHIALRKATIAELPEIDLEDKMWYDQIPMPLRQLYRLCLFSVTVMNGIYFIAATVFLAVLSGNIIVTLFLGFLVQWNYVFPLGATLVMTAVQGMTLCSRAIDVLVALMFRKVIPPFECIGRHWGGIAQMTLFAVVMAIQFIIFCVYASRETPLEALQVSFATGWISAVFIVAIFHALFFFGWMSDARLRLRSGGGTVAFPFYMFLNLHESEELSGIPYRVRTSSCVICGFPVFLSMLLGIGFLISRAVGFSVAVSAASIAGAFVVNYYSEAMASGLSSKLLCVSLWIASMVWLFDCFAFGFRNYSNIWGVSVIVASLLTGWCILFALTCVTKDDSSKLLRIGLISLVVLLIGCWLSVFPVVGWEIGVFCLALMLHNGLGLLFCRADLTNIGGVFVLSLAVLLLVVSCVLLGWNGTSPQNILPRSLPSADVPPALSPIVAYHRYPVCSLRMDGGLGIVDFSLLTEIVNLENSTAFAVDFNNWFNTTDFTYGGVVKLFETEGEPWGLHRFDSVMHNVTVLTLHNKYAFTSIISMTAWLGSIALSPLHIFLPTEWSTMIVYIISFVARLINFSWLQLHRELARYVEAVKRTEPKQVILTGSGVAGGIASMAGTVSRTQTFVFGSPGLLHLLRHVKLDETDYHNYVLSVGASNGVLDNVGGRDTTVTQKMRCEFSSHVCLSMEYISAELLDMCDTSGRRHASFRDVYLL